MGTGSRQWRGVRAGRRADIGGMRESLTRLKVPHKTGGGSVIFGGCVPFNVPFGNGGSGIPPSSRSDACQRGFLNFASNEAGYIREHFVKAWPIHSDFRHPEPCSPRPQYRLRGGRGDAKEAGTAQPRIERPQLRPMLNAARAAFAGVGPFRRKRVAWVVAPNDGVSGQLMENVLTHLSAPPCHLYVAFVPRMGQFVGQAGGARRLSLGGPGCCHGRAVSE